VGELGPWAPVLLDRQLDQVAVRFRRVTQQASPRLGEPIAIRRGRDTDVEQLQRPQQADEIGRLAADLRGQGGGILLAGGQAIGDVQLDGRVQQRGVLVSTDCLLQRLLGCARHASLRMTTVGH
jgi:hypothetical protein